MIAGRGSGYNWFVSVQAEPGQGSVYFDFDNRSEANAVIGHDNTFHGAASEDPAFLFQEGRTFHMGNFNSSSPGGAKGIDFSRTMEIHGTAWIQNLTHGGAAVRLGLQSEAVEVVDDEPLILNDTTRHTLRISNLGLAAASPDRAARVGGAFYEITIAGPGVGAGGVLMYLLRPIDLSQNPRSRRLTPVFRSVCDVFGGRSRYLGKFVVTPVGAMPEHGVQAPFLSVAALEQRRLQWREDSVAGEGAIEIELDAADVMRELAVEVRRAGHACTTARVELV